MNGQRNTAANPECQCGHARDGHYKRRGTYLRMGGHMRDTPLPGPPDDSVILVYSFVEE